MKNSLAYNSRRKKNIFRFPQVHKKCIVRILLTILSEKPKKKKKNSFGNNLYSFRTSNTTTHKKKYISIRQALFPCLLFSKRGKRAAIALPGPSLVNPPHRMNLASHLLKTHWTSYLTWQMGLLVLP